MTSRGPGDPARTLASGSRSRRTLVYVLNSGNLYGTERMALTTLAGLDEYRERVVFAPPAAASASVLDAARQAGYAVEEFTTRASFVRALLRWLLRRRRVDLIGTGVGQSRIAHALSRLCLVHLRQLLVAHGGLEEKDAYGRIRKLNRIGVRVVAVSGYVRGRLIEHGVREDAIRVIENFVVGRPEATRRPPFDPLRVGARAVDAGRTRVVVVSRIDAIKRVDLLVDAVNAPGLEAFEFDVYGNGTELEPLRARCTHPRLRFHGFANDVPERLARADFLLHLCPVEPFGLVILEAFLGGVPVIVPDAGGAGSIVVSGVNGFKFRANDVADLRRVLLEARATAPEVLQRLVDAGSESLGRRFSPEAGLERYREALAR